MPTSPLPPDPYKILGVAKDATKETIRGAYKKLALSSHPDKFPDEIKAQKAEEFLRVKEAHEILSNERTRENYDARVRLAELKAERFREEANSPKRQDPPYSPRPSTERVWTSQPIFEEIRPRRHYEDHPPPPPPASRPGPRYEDQPYRGKSYDDYDDFVPHGTTKKAGSTRLSEARVDETPNRARSRWRAAIPKVTEKHREREKEYEERRRTRDKGRRDDGQSKRQYNRSSLDGETASETDPEIDAFMNSPHGHKKESSRSYDDDKHHSRRKYESRTSSLDREAKEHSTFHSAAEYIAKSLGSKAAASTRRPSLGRGQSSANQLPPPPPPAPSVPISPAVEEVTRSSARRNATSKASKSSKMEIVEPAPSRKRDYDLDARVPDLKSSLTSPTTLKPSRSNTMEVPRSEPPRPVRRSATSPLTPSIPASHSQKSSRLGRDIHDSGYSSPGTPDNQTPRSKKTVYTLAETDSESEVHVIPINPKHRPQTTREQSLHSMPHRSERTTTSSGSTRHAANRSHTDESASHHRRPTTLSRGATDRGGALYGELRASPEPRVQYETRRYGKDDIHYANYQRRSPDHGSHAYERRPSIPIRSSKTQEVKGY